MKLIEIWTKTPLSIASVKTWSSFGERNLIIVTAYNFINLNLFSFRIHIALNQGLPNN